jgi:PAS domain S-box-containing protein
MRSRYLVILMLAISASLTSRPAVADDRPRRVLILDSFAQGVAPMNEYVLAFRSELRDRWPGPLDLFEFSLGAARSPDLEDNGSLVNFIAAHVSRDPVDLVVVSCEPAMRFAVQHRKRLFPDVPLLIMGVEVRRIPPEFVGPNTAAVCVRNDLPLAVENILRVLPGTRKIAIALGVSPLERFWSDEFHRAFAQFEDRVQLYWLEGLPVEAMKREVASLPRDSVVLYCLLLRDADGMSFEGNHALARLIAASNAPVFGCMESHLGAGIVGGRLFSDRSLGGKAAIVAARILQGEKPSSIQSPPIEARTWTFDSRELERWHIAEDSLPAGSTVLFRPPSFWQVYRRYILGLLAIVALQTALITMLVLQGRRRSRVERQLAQSERRMHLIADSLPALIAYVDRDQRYVFINRAYETWFAIDPEKARGRAIRDVLGNDLYQLALPYVERVLAGEQVTFSSELTMTRGQRRTIEALYVPDHDDQGVVRGYFALVVDVTDRKHAELEARKVRDELAHAGRIATMGEMAAALAHEINQPLAAILSNAQAAKRFLNAPDPDLAEFRSILDDIVDDDARAGEVIRRIRSLVKKDPADLRPLNVNTILKEVIRLLHNDAAIRGVVVFHELDPFVEKVLGDRIQLQQVLLNLFLNAFDAMRDGLSQDRIVLARSRQVDSDVLVTVSDKGPGIAPEEMDRLFEPFRSTKPGGLGMGLSISRSIVQSHGGRMWAENNSTRGATFSFSLPVHAEVHAELSVSVV